jgi:hypothetical protein
MIFNSMKLLGLRVRVRTVSGFTPNLLLARPSLGTSLSTTSDALDDVKLLVTDDDPRFPSLLVGFNQRFYANNAKAVYFVRTPEEVALAIDDVLDNYQDGLKVRSGGHCYENFVMNNSTKGIIDVGFLTDYGIDPEKGYYLSTGETNWSAFKKIFNKWGVVLPGGSCYSVGLGGHISGGGDGIMSRLHGTTVDWVTGMEIVVKDKPNKPAYVKYISEENDPDLFWACRGAGNGNFGIITKYYFKELPKAPKGAIISNLAFKWKNEEQGEVFDAPTLKKILDEYVDFAASKDNWISSAKFQIMHEAAEESQMTVHTAYHNEKEKEEAKAYHNELEKKLDNFYTISSPCAALAGHAGYWSRPSKRNKEQDRSDAVADTRHDFPFYDATQTMNPSGPNQRGKYKSAYQKEHFPMEQVKAIINNLKKVPEGLELEDMKQSMCQIDCFGGQINEIEPTATAIAQRAYVVKLQFQTYWTSEEDDDKFLGWMNEFYHKDMYGKYGGIPDPDAPGGHMFQGCYYNYPDVDLNKYGGLDKALSLYFLDNYEKNERNLVDVKRRWDPANFFNHAQSIPVKPTKVD